ncbi:MAG: radical SAM protein [Candidatus Sulfotelmatobacter sp.]
MKSNLPCTILEYPNLEEYRAALNDPADVLGISFYINETELVLKMVEMARRAGVKEIWAGNYGGYSSVDGVFDRVFTGWGEAQVASLLGLPPIMAENLIHPEMYGAIGTNLFPEMLFSGLLFTSRGCPWTCNFCQTPGFYGKVAKISLETIEKAIWTYRRRGVTGINILDENFGTFTSHSNDVVDLLHRYKIRWIALTRVDTLLKNFDYWEARGLFGAHLGIESLNQSSLSGAVKKISQLDSIKLLEKMKRHHMFVQAFYILGFEQDTVQSIRDDIERLAELEIDVVQVQVLTPFPKTEQRASIESNYGISDTNLSKYNARNLVWNHPHIDAEAMRDLQRWANIKLASSRRALRTLAKFAVFCGRRKPGLHGARLLFRNCVGGRSLHKTYAHNIESSHQWARTGWYPYEEVEDRESTTRKMHDIVGSHCIY